jgi:predicted nucleic acid-binding protein
VTRFGIDAPTLLRLAREDRSPHSSHRLVAPNSLRTRALELVLQEVQTGQLSDDQALQLHERMTEVKVRLLGDRVSRRVAWKHARRVGALGLAGAEHLAVTELQADTLLTADPELRAMAAGVVPLADFEDLFTDEAPRPSAGPTTSAEAEHARGERSTGRLSASC